MKAIHPVLKTLLVLAMAAMLALLVSAPNAWAEEEVLDKTQLPVFEPVVLKGTDEALPIEGRAPYAGNEACYDVENLTYLDDSLYVKIYPFRVWDTNVFAAYIQIADASQLRTEQAAKYPSKTTQRVDVMAQNAKAVIAVNADYFIYHSEGIVYRQGKLLRNRSSEGMDGLIVDMKGNLHLSIPANQADFDALTEPVLHSFCFGPALVVDGVLKDNSARVVTYKSRCGIGQLDELTYLVMVCDGDDPDIDSKGLSIPQFAELFQALGAKNAYNLDGGSSTTMVFHGKKVNGNVKRFRPVGDILYFATAVQE